MTTKIDISKDPNSNAISVKFAKGRTLQDFVFEVLSMPDFQGNIYIYDTDNVIRYKIRYKNGEIASASKLIFSLYSDYCIEDITGYITYGYYTETNFTVYLTESKEESEKDDLSDSSYRNRTIDIISNTWLYGIRSKYSNLDLTKLSDKGLHALENSLTNLDFVLNQIEKGRYEE